MVWVGGRDSLVRRGLLVLSLGVACGDGGASADGAQSPGESAEGGSSSAEPGKSGSSEGDAGERGSSSVEPGESGSSSVEPGGTESASVESGESGGSPEPGYSGDAEAFLRTYEDVRREAGSMSLSQFYAKYAMSADAELGYDPASAAGLDAIEAAYPLGSAAKEVLDARGFVAVRDAEAPTFEEVYHEIYEADLPVMVTTDSIAYALHRSFDAILRELEQYFLAEESELMLGELREGLAAGAPAEVEAAAYADLDVYLTVALQLLTEESFAAVTGAEADARVAAIMDAIAAEQPSNVTLFGVTSLHDFSQMRPRGHYEGDPLLERYFRAMMWMGRTEFPLVTFAAGVPEFNPVAFDAAALLDELLQDSPAMARWERMDGVLRTMIGETDSMAPSHLRRFMQDLGAESLAEVAALPDDAVMNALLAGDYGLQQIMSQIIYTSPHEPEVVLPRVYLLMGQRFTLDSYIFHHVTYDRLPPPADGEAKPPRMLPNELDVQFVLGNDAAAPLLEDELEDYGHQGVLHQLRFLVDSYPDEYWNTSFYTGWLQSIRALNPAPEERHAYPPAMRSAAWSAKTLNTQAASRAELRHDTLLYAKQSYSGGVTCEYPDGYVEPAAAFYAQMGHLGVLGQDMIAVVEDAGYEVPDAHEYFVHWSATMQTLQDIAQLELRGEPLAAEHVAFLGQIIEEEIIGCGETWWDGWYPALFFDRNDVAKAKPTVADTHTAPTDADGNEVGWVLHGATGSPMLLVMTVPGCEGSDASAYVGPISSFYEVVTEGYERLTDSTWLERLRDEGGSNRPSWVGEFAPPQ